MHWRDLLVFTWHTHNRASVLNADFAKMAATLLKLERLANFCEGIRRVNHRTKVHRVQGPDHFELMSPPGNEIEPSLSAIIYRHTGVYSGPEAGFCETALLDCGRITSKPDLGDNLRIADDSES